MPDSVNVIRFPIYFKIGEYALWRGLLRKILSTTADVVHLNTYGYYHTDIISLLRKYKKFKTVLTSHGFHGLESSFNGQYYKSVNRLRSSVRPFYDYTLGMNEITSADALVALSNHDARILKWLGASAKKIREIPLGVRDIFFQAGNATLQECLRSRFGDGPIILSVGELSAVKGKDIMLHAFVHLVKDYPNAKLVYVGKDGGLLKTLQQLISQFGLEKNVFFEGYVPSQNLIDYYHIADVLIHSSYFEGVSTVLLEAMAAGLPVVSTPAGGNGQLLLRSQAGIVVPFNNIECILNATKNILYNKKQQNMFGTNGRLYVLKHHTWNSIVSTYLSLYQSLVMDTVTIA